MISGKTKDILLLPRGYKDLNPEETFIPYQIDLRNGRATDAGNWEKRPGYAEWRDLSLDEKITSLIPVGLGYATTQYGKVYRDIALTPIEMTGKALTGNYRPRYEQYDDLTIIVDGGIPLKIEKTDTSLLETAPNNSRFIARISGYTIMSGYSSHEFQWSASGNPENFSTGDSGFANVKKDSGTIRNMFSYREKLFFGKDHSFEVWYKRGGSTPFVRLNELTIPIGTDADDSIVLANNTFYWWGDDGDFYVLNGNDPLVLSKPYRSYLDDKITVSSDCYGFDFRKENVIRWFFPTNGICIVWDYLKSLMYEDNTWMHGQFERLPINSYMELRNEQYFGDYEPTGKIYHWSKDYKDDNGNPIRV